MLRMAICDDDSCICRHLQETISLYAKNNQLKITVDIFFSGEELQNRLSVGSKYDLIFLDIEMAKLNGIDLGEFIREELQDEIVQIVYISSKSSYAMALFKNRPMDFLIKPVSEKSIEKAVDRAIKIFNKNIKCFEFIENTKVYKVPYRDIIYFESNGRKIVLHTMAQNYEFYDKLSRVTDIVSSGDFINIHKSYIVNYMYITQVHYEELIMITGTTLPISQKNRKSVREALCNRRKQDNI